VPGADTTSEILHWLRRTDINNILHFSTYFSHHQSSPSISIILALYSDQIALTFSFPRLFVPINGEQWCLN
jgi:hypothetical protein